MTGCRVLLVCTGNRYRSPIAEGLLAARLAAVAVADVDVTVSSAGTRARPGAEPDPWTAAIVAGFGGSIEGFVSTRLTPDLVGAADLVLGMAREHREAAVRLRPTALRRCFVLEEFVRLSRSAPTPALPGPVGSLRPLGASGALGAVRRAAAARGLAVATVRPEDEDVPDPELMPDRLRGECVARIDRAVTAVAATLAAVPAPAWAQPR